jgi:hypothetical protein
MKSRGRVIARAVLRQDGQTLARCECCVGIGLPSGANSLFTSFQKENGRGIAKKGRRSAFLPSPVPGCVADTWGESSCAALLAFSKGKLLVCGDVAQHLGQAARRLDRDAINTSGRAEAEVKGPGSLRKAASGCTISLAIYWISALTRRATLAPRPAEAITCRREECGGSWGCCLG